MLPLVVTPQNYLVVPDQALGWNGHKGTTHGRGVFASSWQCPLWQKDSLGGNKVRRTAAQKQGRPHCVGPTEAKARGRFPEKAPGRRETESSVQANGSLPQGSDPGHWASAPGGHIVQSNLSGPVTAFDWLGQAKRKRGALVPRVLLSYNTQRAVLCIHRHN